jgi:NRPS condensation-like uncharacterized protein
MTKFKYYILGDIRDEVKIGYVLDHMRGYINTNGHIISFSIMDNMVFLHYGDVDDIKSLHQSMESMSSNKYSINNWKAFSNAEKAFLYMETKELYKVWILE